MNTLDRATRRRVLKVVAALVFSTSVIVSFAQFRKPPPTRVGYGSTSGETSVGGLPSEGANALSYRELRETQRGPARSVYLDSVEALRARLPALSEPFVRKPGEREHMLELRAARRAFDGAPPTVPHPVDDRAIPNCLVCHEHGAMVGQLRAPAMSHVVMGSCLQCHVSRADEHGSPAAHATLADGNRFEALPFGGTGSRAWLGAPPTRPHPLAMRTECSSCHGVSGHPGLRTSHPERQNCEQCHAGAEGVAGPNAILASGGGL